MKQWSRREFIRLSAIVAAAGGFSTVSGCVSAPAASLVSAEPEFPLSFLHGVASGDPLHDRVVLWTRVTPAGPLAQVQLRLEVATDAAFRNLVVAADCVAHADQDYCAKVDAAGLSAGQAYFYRFRAGSVSSPVGQTRTLPQGALSTARFAVVSCSNYPAGYFHVYQQLAERSDLDAVVHLGDYLYEYAADGYATERAAEFGRFYAPDNRCELLTLQDYRRRYACYRADAALQQLHGRHPFLLVWDDHEIANDIWTGGAENHSPGEGDFQARKLAALQAYYEWLPIRPHVQQGEPLYRSLAYGDLVQLYLLDTRVCARSQWLDFPQFQRDGKLDVAAMTKAVQDPTRTLLGPTQLDWLSQGLTQSACHWQVLAQQVLMARMELPGEALAALGKPGPELLSQLQQLADLKALPTEQLTSAQRKRLQGVLPYNLDAWDGFPVERERLYQRLRDSGRQVLVLAGDTHNAWHSELKNAAGEPVGVELATASVSSPGIEQYLQLDEAQATQLSRVLPQLIDELAWCELSRRGYLLVEFTQQQCRAQWHQIASVHTTKAEWLAPHQLLIARR
ncbi:MAG: alkaline phosphatase [Rheinheimera sp.]|nr:MAG: alkaline phosphatase [Rheinheimera sp.]